MFITHLASSGRKVATINRALVSISQAHKMGGHPSPTSAVQILETLKGIRRNLGTRQRQKAALETANLRVMVAELGDNLLGLRDRALLLVGFAGALRRSELIGLNLDNIEFTADGLVITIERSKTDQEGHGRRIGLPHGGSPLTCPVRTLSAWLTAANITDGPVFRGVGRWDRVGSRRLNDRGVARILKKHVSMIGLDPSHYAGHSLRSGFATSAARAGKSERAIMSQTGHNSVAMVRRYIHQGSLFADNAAAGLL
jgi:integrase